MPSIGEICTAIHLEMETLVPATLRRVQNYDELTEGMNTTPTLQVYPERWSVDVGGDTDRTTFVDTDTGVPGVRQTEVEVHMALYARRRSQLNEDWREATNIANAINDVLEQQGPCPMFDCPGIRSFSWTATRVEWEYAGANVRFAGYEFVLTLRIF